MPRQTIMCNVNAGKSLELKKPSVPAQPSLYLQDYVVALVLNETREALVWVHEKPGGGTYWQMMERYLQPGEEPFTAVQQTLLMQTGRQTSQWVYLGSHVVDANQPAGVGYFFCAKQTSPSVPKLQTKELCKPQAACPKWVPLNDLRYALLDGRLAVANHALVVSLAFLTFLK